MRVYDLAKQVGLTNKELMEKLIDMGVEVKSHSSSIDDKSVRAILESMEGQKPKPPAPVMKPAASPKIAPEKKPVLQESPPPAPVETPEPIPSKIDARALALQALERAKARRAQQHQAQLEHPVEQEPVQPLKVVAPEHQRVELGGVRSRQTQSAEPSVQEVAPPSASAAQPQEQPAPATAAPTPPPAPVERKEPPTPTTPISQPQPAQPAHAARETESARGQFPPRPSKPPMRDQQRPGGGRSDQRTEQRPDRGDYRSDRGERGGFRGGERSDRGPSSSQRPGSPYPARRTEESFTPGTGRPGGHAAPGAGRPGQPQQRVIRRNVELQQLPSLPKRKAPPARGGKSDDLTVPTIDVMRLRPVRRPGAKKTDAEKDAAEKAARKRPALAKQQVVGGKKIRPGRFLNITALEETPVVDRTGKAPKQKAGQAQGHKQAAPVPLPKVFQLYGDLTVAEFAERIHSTPQEIILKSMTLGEMLSINQLISHDLCELIATDLGINIEIVEETDELDVAHVTQAEVADEDRLPRPPVVTVMGHVDHGKTSLLDAIRKTNVAEGEFGGITQHIGAYRVQTHRGEIVFLDTPGHAAFTAMRARGASVTDIVILIVAADDGVMPQTIEAINHARAANAPIIVAINKVDKPGANVQKVRNDLMQYSLIGEELGGDTIICEVSAKKGIGIDNLLEMIQLQSEIMELKAPQHNRSEGVIIESNVDPQRGITATVLVQTGTLKAGDPFVCGDVSGRVRLMLDDRGQRVDKALPSYPVKILGLDGCPQVGEKFLVLETEREAREIAQVREQRRRRQAQNKGMRPHMTLEGLSSYLSEETKSKDLNIILKADVQGSVEAVSDAMMHLSTEKVSVRLLHAAVGAVTETDVQLAMASDAVIIGFNVRPDNAANDLAQQEGIEIKTYRVIYELLEEIAAAMLGLLDRKFKEVARGAAEIRQVFKISKFGNVAGCYVTSGTITRNDKMRLVRDGKVVYQGTLATLRRIKDDVKEVQAGYECGITFTNFNDFREGDVIETYTEEEVHQTL